MQKTFKIGISVVALVILFLVALFLYAFFNQTCYFDGLGVGYYVDKTAFDSQFSYLDLNIGNNLNMARIDFNDEKAVWKYAEQNSIARETNGCNGSNYYVKEGTGFRSVSRAEMIQYLEKNTSCNNCTILVGHAMGQLVLKQSVEYN